MTEANAWVTSELLIAVEGDDGRTWLNGQITGDLTALSVERPVYGLILNVKGRILGDALALEHPEHGLLVAVPESAWPVLAPHLEHYIIMEDVTLTPRPDLRLVTLQGAAPGEPGWHPHARLGGEGYDKVVRASEIEATLASLPARRIEEAEAEPLRIRAGKPRFALDFGDTTYPQEAGLEKTAVSFKKGCYLGQEVICMLESRGQVSRRLVRVESDAALRRGDALVSAAGEPIGEITSAAEALGLALVKRAHAKAGESMKTAAGSDVKVVALA